jgi:hypothetical protein
MISPQRNEINELRRIVIDSIRNVDYESADLGFDRLSGFYYQEFIRYSEIIDEIKDEELKGKLLEELTLRMDEWRAMIELQEDFGTIN